MLLDLTIDEIELIRQSLMEMPMKTVWQLYNKILEQVTAHQNEEKKPMAKVVKGQFMAGTVKRIDQFDPLVNGSSGETNLKLNIN